MLMWVALLALQDGVWLKNLDEGKREAARSGKPMLIVTLCAPKGCDPCAEFRAAVIAKPDETHRKALSNFTPVEWAYDGPKGRVMQWVREHGITQPDPAYCVWILDAKGEEFARWGDRKYIAAEFVEWLNEQSGKWGGGKKSKPTRIAFVDVKVEPDEQGEPTVARDKDKPALLYFQLPGQASGFGFKGRGEEIKACRDFDKSPLSSAAVIEPSLKFECLRIDYSKEEAVKLAARYGVDAVPALVLIPAGDAKPRVFIKKVSDKGLAAALQETAP
jgi:hypothetical protein